jgi:Heterokaryon incompatibility protein (HET)
MEGPTRRSPRACKLRRDNDNSQTVGDDHQSNSSGNVVQDPSWFSQGLGVERNFDRRGGLNTNATSTPTGLCSSCRQLVSAKLFKTLCTKSTKSLKVGQLQHARAMQKLCLFCRFLVEAYELADTQPAAAMRKNRKTHGNIYFNDHIEDGPWYTVAGIEADLPPVPTAWLGLSSRREAPHRYICISFVPKAASSEGHNKRAYAYPRQRTAEGSKDFADYSLIKSWIKVCRTYHPGSCGKSVDFQRQFMRLKLIDVYERVVKLVQDCAPYIALSYVWGEVPKGQERGTRQQQTSEVILKSSGSYPLPKRLPKTIEDALTVVKRLGERYLWVDAYCINQNDEAEMKLQIDNMRLVYECASLTIVAMDGVNAEAGLSGVSRPLQQRYQPVVDMCDYRLMATFVDPVSDNHGTAPWGSRAWTFQEGILSRRCVFFDQKHITMRCLQESFHDTMEVDVREDRVPTLQDDRYFWENGFGLDIHSPR